MNQVPSQSSFLKDEPTQVIQPFLVGEMLQALFHLCGPPLDSLQEIPVFFVPGSPELDTVLQVNHTCGCTPSGPMGFSLPHHIPAGPDNTPILLPGGQAVFLHFIDLLFDLIHELFAHPHRCPASLPQFPTLWDAPILSLEEVLFKCCLDHTYLAVLLTQQISV